MVKLASLHSISLKVAEPIDGVSEESLYEAENSDEILLIVIAYPFNT